MEEVSSEPHKFLHVEICQPGGLSREPGPLMGRGAVLRFVDGNVSLCDTCPAATRLEEPLTLVENLTGREEEETLFFCNRLGKAQGSCPRQAYFAAYGPAPIEGATLHRAQIERKIHCIPATPSWPTLGKKAGD